MEAWKINFHTASLIVNPDVLGKLVVYTTTGFLQCTIYCEHKHNDCMFWYNLSSLCKYILPLTIFFEIGYKYYFLHPVCSRTLYPAVNADVMTFSNDHGFGLESTSTSWAIYNWTNGKTWTLGAPAMQQRQVPHICVSELLDSTE